MALSARNPRLPVAVLRNCPRCTREFVAEPGQIVCDACRVYQSEELDQKLTVRERQICKLISRGNGNKAIASELHLSEGTVKEYLHRIFRKRQVTNRTQLAIWFVRLEHRQRMAKVAAKAAI